MAILVPNSINTKNRLSVKTVCLAKSSLSSQKGLVLPAVLTLIVAASAIMMSLSFNLRNNSADAYKELSRSIASAKCRAEKTLSKVNYEAPISEEIIENQNIKNYFNKVSLGNFKYIIRKTSEGIKLERTY